MNFHTHVHTEFYFQGNRTLPSHEEASSLMFPWLLPQITTTLILTPYTNISTIELFHFNSFNLVLWTENFLGFFLP